MIGKELQDKIRFFGQMYTPAVCPDDIMKGKLTDCFDHCLMVAIHSNGKYTYVEGWALDPADMSRVILHAWLTDGVRAFDPTWQCLDTYGRELPIPTVYYGIPMDTETIARFVSRSGYKSVISNGWRKPDLAQACVPAGFKIEKI